MQFDMPSNKILKKAHGLATTSMVLPDAHPNANFAGPTVHIYGLTGEIQVWGPAHRPQSVKVIPKPGHGGGEPYQKDFPIPAGGHGLFWEADAAARSWSAGKLECHTIPWEESILVMEAVDKIRQQADIVFPKEIETAEYPIELASRGSRR
jgi:hypothetical protein